MKIIAPRQGEAAYAHAVSAFRSLWEQITSQALSVAFEDDGTEDVVIIGSDAVNDALTDSMIAGKIADFGIRYGTDDYCIRCFAENGRGGVVNNSRGILCAYKKLGGTYYEAARQACVAMKEDLCSVLKL